MASAADVAKSILTRVQHKDKPSTNQHSPAHSLLDSTKKETPFCSFPSAHQCPSQANIKLANLGLPEIRSTSVPFPTDQIDYEPSSLTVENHEIGRTCPGVLLSGESVQPRQRGFLPIENYGMIGNMRTTALVATDASIDFMCFPKFDSPTVFCRLLDDEKGGYFQIHPTEVMSRRQQYLPNSNVLVTRFMTNRGASQVTDFMPVPDTANREHDSPPRMGAPPAANWFATPLVSGTSKPLYPWLIRVVETVRGTVDFDVTVQPAFNYALSSHETSVIPPKRNQNDPRNHLTPGFVDAEYTPTVVFRSQDSLVLDLRYVSYEACNETGCSSPLPEIQWQLVQDDANYKGAGVTTRFCLHEGQQIWFVMRERPMYCYDVGTSDELVECGNIDVDVATIEPRIHNLHLFNEPSSSSGLSRRVDAIDSRDGFTLDRHGVLPSSSESGSPIPITSDQMDGQPEEYFISGHVGANANQFGAAIMTSSDMNGRPESTSAGPDLSRLPGTVNLQCSNNIGGGQPTGVTIVADDLDPPLTVRLVQSLLRSTLRFWNQWIGQMTYKGRWRETVQRSALTLKLLTYQPTGAIIAAPTFSLPEEVCGNRTWDYRWVWLRDSSFVVYAFLRLGLISEARCFMRFIELVARDRNPDGSLNVMYTIEANRDIPELELTHLKGYRGSKPVRIGNAASSHLQLDIYGALLDTVYLMNKGSSPVGYDMWCVCQDMVNYVVSAWKQPDMSIWEVRGKPLNFVYSKVMCWVACDRGLRLAEKRMFPCPDREKWLSARDEIYLDIMTKGWDQEKQYFKQSYENSILDASVLIMPLVFFISPTDPRILSTISAILRPPEHGGLTSNGQVYRYIAEATDDGIESGEGSFTMCTFWLIECLTRAGLYMEKYKARALYAYEQTLSFGNHLQLFSEEISPAGELVGNFPQAFTHIALISCAFNLDRMLNHKHGDLV